jgi:hypothetical protein
MPWWWRRLERDTGMDLCLREHDVRAADVCDVLVVVRCGLCRRLEGVLQHVQRRRADARPVPIADARSVARSVAVADARSVAVAVAVAVARRKLLLLP